MCWKALAYKLYLFALAAVVAASAFYTILKMAPEEKPFSYAIAAFFVLYFLTPAVFGAKVEPTDDGLKVEQWIETLIAYKEIRNCHSFIFPPGQAVVITTQQRFPLSILFTGDRLVGPRRSLRQDGKLALQVKSKLRSLATAGT